MSDNIVEFPAKGKFEVEYVMNGPKVIGMTHPLWPFRIQRKNDKIALVSEDDDQPFGELDADVFNTILTCWLMIDDIDGLREAAKDE